MRTITGFLLLLFCIPALYATSYESLPLKEPVQATATRFNNQTLEISYAVDTDEIFLEFPEEIESFLQSNGEMNSIINSTPLLPAYGRMVRLPIQGSGRVVLTEIDFNVLTETEFAEVAGYDDAFSIYAAEYEPVDAWFPEDIVCVDEPNILKDFRVATVTTFPVQVNPFRREVRIYSDIDAQLIFDQADNRNTLQVWPTAISEMYLPIYRQLLDWNDTELDNYELYRGNVQVVVRHEPAILSILQPWIEWKEQKGYELQLLTDNDVNQWINVQIKEELRERYEDSPVPFDHVVIIGDAVGGFSVPPGEYGNGSDLYGSGDHAYACLVGDDDLMDVSVGRISVETTNDLIAYVNKVLSYERDPHMNETGWYRRGSVAAGSAVSGISTVFTCEYARELMLRSGYTSVNTAYYNDNGGDVNNRTVQTLNNGVSFHLYRGVAGSGLEPSEILALNNTYLLPFVIDITCGRGNWADNFSINEAFMRAGTATQPRGGIGAMSTATSNTHTRFNNALSGGGVYAAFVQQCPTLGEVLVGCKLNLWNNLHEYQPDYVADFNRWMNLMGDPTVWVWTDIPGQLTVTNESSSSLGENGYEVVVNHSGAAVPDAWVTLYKSDMNETEIARGVTDDAGRVLLEPVFAFSGEATLTVTAKNMQPYQETIAVTSPTNRIGVTEVTVLDDGTNGTIGNGNGVADYNETVGLLLTLQNYGTATENNILVSASSEDPFVLSITENPTLGSLQPDEEQALETPILVHIDPNTPNSWRLEIEISIQTNLDTYTGSNLVTAFSPVYTTVQANISEGFSPGEEGDVTITIANIGRGQGAPADVTLECDHEWVNVLQSDGTLPSINAGNTATSSNFRIEASPLAFRGFPAPAVLIVTMQNGWQQTIPVRIPLGALQENDPVGPDEYGYYAFDDTDTGYILCPTYNWIEINPSVTGHVYNGNLVNLSDFGENQDDAEVINLPFDFTYYGQTVSEITVCSNGWIAIGDQQHIAQARNWTIPSPLGPFGMIAPLWDDRILPLSESDGGVYSYLSPSNDFAIIEWDRVYDGLRDAPCTFQVILYARNEASPTPTGDNEFLFQYKETQPSMGEWASVPYWTTGIENPDKSDGLQLCYYNICSSGTAPIDNERAIFFTTRTSTATGTIYGTVTYSDDNSPIPGVNVFSSGFGTNDITGEDGSYVINVVPGIVSLTFERSGFETVIVTDIVAVAGESIEVNAIMDRPAFMVEPTNVVSYIEPGEEIQEELLLSNNISDPIFYETAFRYTSSGSAENPVGELLDEYAIDISEDERIVDIFVQNGHLWALFRTDNSNSTIRKYALNGTLISSYNIVFDDYYTFTWYDDEFILMNSDELLYYTYSETTGFTLDHTFDHNLFLNEEDHVLFDPINELFYINGWFFLIEVYSMEGAHRGSIDIGNLALDIKIANDDPSGMTLHYLTAEDGPEGSFFTMNRVNPETEECEFIFTVTEDWNPIPLAFSVVTNPGDMYQTIYIYLHDHVDDETNYIHSYRYLQVLDWMFINNPSGSIPAGETESFEFTLGGPHIEQGIYEGLLEVVAPEYAIRIEVPVELYVGVSDLEDPAVDLPREWTIESIWPNPFNPCATVQFSLPQSSPVHAVLYNVLGQEVLTVVDEALNAGTHTVMIDGSSLASGLYFFHLESGAFCQTRKIVLLK